MITWLFDETCEKAYMRVSNPEYSLDETLAILHYFFDVYEEHRGEPHPPLTVANLIRIIERLPGEIGFDADEYPWLIDTYFENRYRDCDYRINHFLSGRIREILSYRIM